MDKTKIQQNRENLMRRDQVKKREAEAFRQQVLREATKHLKRYFSAFPQTSVYLFGSVVSPGRFGTGSDIDIAVENHPENRLSLFSALSDSLPYPFDLVIMERCPFADDIRQRGVKVQ